MTVSTPIKIFAGGSRHISRLDPEILHRLDTIIGKNLPVIIGDAYGADTAIQQHLHGRNYRAVHVFCSGHHCRNNIGDWPVRAVAFNNHERNVRFYSAKDLIMANEAAFGLMIWDGESIGTLANILRLLTQRKKAVIYTAPQKTASTLKSISDWDRFMAHRRTQLRTSVEQRMRMFDSP